jgi:hypothetical protein
LVSPASASIFGRCLILGDLRRGHGGVRRGIGRRGVGARHRCVGLLAPCGDHARVLGRLVLLQLQGAIRLLAVDRALDDDVLGLGVVALPVLFLPDLSQHAAELLVQAGQLVRRLKGVLRVGSRLLIAADERTEVLLLLAQLAERVSRGLCLSWLLALLRLRRVLAAGDVLGYIGHGAPPGERRGVGVLALRGAVFVVNVGEHAPLPIRGVAGGAHLVRLLVLLHPVAGLDPDGAVHGVREAVHGAVVAFDEDVAAVASVLHHVPLALRVVVLGVHHLDDHAIYGRHCGVTHLRRVVHADVRRGQLPGVAGRPVLGAAVGVDDAAGGRGSDVGLVGHRISGGNKKPASPHRRAGRLLPVLQGLV